MLQPFVYPENMRKNLDLTGGLIFSQEVLLALVKKGTIREDAYAMVQKNAMDVWNNGLDFKSKLLNDSDVGKYLPSDEIEALFDGEKVKHNINKIFKRLDLI